MAFKASALRASHDTQAPPNLISFMLKDWRKPTGKLPKAHPHVRAFARRREALSRLFPGEALLIPTGHLKVRANDTHYDFRPGSDFYYLTGCLQADCVLLLAPEGNGHRAILFVEPNPGKTDPMFFTDRVKGELWTGPRPGLPEFRALHQIEDTRPLSEFEATIRSTCERAPKGYRLLRGYSERAESTTNDRLAGNLDQVVRDQELATALSELRLIKDDEELRELAKAVAATKLGFEDVIRRLKTAKGERELEGVFYTRARMEGNHVGYHSIVASGAHACTLHWGANDGALHKEDLLLLDAGIEGRTLYTADITRTLPVGGRFTREQREIYELVLAAQAAAFDEVRPGNDFMDPNRAAMRVLAHGLEKLGILPTTAEEALREENQFYKRYSLHNVSHMLGLDVHDCAQARAETYKFGKLVPGMVLTVEPGLYFQLDDLTVPARYRGIGVRIEDDVVVTARGMRNLSKNIPSSVTEIERWMKSLWRGSPSRK